MQMWLCGLQRPYIYTSSNAKHKKLLEWVEQGLDPNEEEARADREALLKRLHDYNNGGMELRRERHRMYMEDHRGWELGRRRRNEREREQRKSHRNLKKMI